MNDFQTAHVTQLGARGRTLARLLAGAWRNSPPTLERCDEALAEATPLVLESGAAALVWWRLRDCEWLPSDVARQLQQAYRHSTIQGDLHQHEIKQAFSILRSAGVEPVLVKGWVAAQLYPEPGLRPSGDIDLCVHPARYDAAQTALNEWKDHQFAVDLHSGFSSLDKENIDDLYSRSQLIGLGEVNVRLLAPEDHLRLLCIHFLRHGAFRPLWLCDIGAAVESLSRGFDWDRCLGTDRRRRGWTACAVGLSHQLLGASLRDAPVGNRFEELPSWLIKNVLSQWDSPNTMNHGVMKHRAPMAKYVRDPRGLLADLRRRWPNPIEATVYTGAPFNALPRWPFQIGECLARTVKFVAGLPKARRESNQQTSRVRSQG